MAKTSSKSVSSKPAKKTAPKNTGGKSAGGDVGSKNFEQRLERLEFLGEQIRRTDIPLDEALSAFEEGVKLAKSLEKDLDKIENRIEILMNSGETSDQSDYATDESPEDESPILELFEADD